MNLLYILDAGSHERITIFCRSVNIFTQLTNFIHKRIRCRHIAFMALCFCHDNFVTMIYLCNVFLHFSSCGIFFFITLYLVLHCLLLFSFYPFILSIMSSLTVIIFFVLGRACTHAQKYGKIYIIMQRFLLLHIYKREFRNMIQ